MGGRDQQQGQDFPRHPARLPGEAVEGGYVEQHEGWLSVFQVFGGVFPRPSDSHGFSCCLSKCGGRECITRHVCRRGPDRQNVGCEKIPLLNTRLPGDMISYLPSRKPCRTPVDESDGRRYRHGHCDSSAPQSVSSEPCWYLVWNRRNTPGSVWMARWSPNT